MQHTGVEGLSDFFKEAYQKNKAVVETSEQPKAETAPRLLTLQEQEVIRAELLERFQAEKQRLVDGLKADVQQGLPTLVALSSGYHPGKEGKSGCIVFIDQFGENPHSASQTYTFLRRYPESQPPRLGHRFLEMKLSVGMATTQFEATIGGQTFAEEQFSAMDPEEKGLLIWQAYINPPATTLPNHK